MMENLEAIVELRAMVASSKKENVCFISLRNTEMAMIWILAPCMYDSANSSNPSNNYIKNEQKLF
jgi:hypothetical protein